MTKTIQDRMPTTPVWRGSENKGHARSQGGAAVEIQDFRGGCVGARGKCGGRRAEIMIASHFNTGTQRGIHNGLTREAD